MALERIIQTRIPLSTANTVEELAAAEGLPVATWLRRLIVKEIGSMQTEAWVVENSSDVNYELVPNYLLRRLPGCSAGALQSDSHVRMIRVGFCRASANRFFSASRD